MMPAMSYAFGIVPRPAGWPRPVIYHCPACADNARACRFACGNGAYCDDFGPTMSGSWSGSTLGPLLDALALPCDELPCEWTLGVFRAAFRGAGASARRARAYDPIRRWLDGVDALGCPDETRVYLA